MTRPARAGSASTSTSWRPMGATPADLARLGEADFNVVLYPEIAGRRRAGWSAPSASPGPGRCRSASAPPRDFVAEVAALAGVDPAAGAGRRALAPALVLALGRFDLPHRQARLRLRRRHPRHRRRPGRRRTSWASRWSGLGTYSREFAREVREAAKALRRRAADHRRLSRGRGQGRRAAARAGARHADGAPHRQAAGHPLRGDLGPGARPGLPRPLLAADGLRGRQRPLRHLGPSADDGPGGASARACSARISSSTTRPRPRISGTAAPAPRRRQRRAGRPGVGWAPEAEKELGKIPFFVRGKARRNTERFAAKQGVALITVETLYDAKAHFGR